MRIEKHFRFLFDLYASFFLNHIPHSSLLAIRDRIHTFQPWIIPSVFVWYYFPTSSYSAIFLAHQVVSYQKTLPYPSSFFLTSKGTKWKYSELMINQSLSHIEFWSWMDDLSDPILFFSQIMSFTDSAVIRLAVAIMPISIILFGHLIEKRVAIQTSSSTVAEDLQRSRFPR